MIHHWFGVPFKMDSASLKEAPLVGLRSSQMNRQCFKQYHIEQDATVTVGYELLAVN